jgi:hypothetical protein
MGNHALTDDLWSRIHASSVKTGMHGIRLLNFFRPILAGKTKAHWGLISTEFEFWCNCKL